MCVCLYHMWLLYFCLLQRWPVAPCALSEAVMKMAKRGCVTSLLRGSVLLEDSYFVKTYYLALCVCVCVHERGDGPWFWVGGRGSADVWIERLSGFRLWPLLLMPDHLAVMQEELFFVSFQFPCQVLYQSEREDGHTIICEYALNISAASFYPPWVHPPINDQQANSPASLAFPSVIFGHIPTPWRIIGLY